MAAVLPSQGALTPFTVPAAPQHLLITLRNTGHDNSAQKKGRRRAEHHCSVRIMATLAGGGAVNRCVAGLESGPGSQLFPSKSRKLIKRALAPSVWLGARGVHWGFKG